MTTHEADIDKLKAEEADLERQLAEVRERRSALERKTNSRTGKGLRPVRDVTLDLLQEAQCALNSLLLASVIRPLYGRNIPSTRFGTLANDEANSYDSSRPRPVYLCHGLTFDRGQAVKRFWVRSDWPLAERIIGPMSGRMVFLRGAAWTINLARLVDEGRVAAENPEILRYVAADQARDAGIPITRGDFPFESWLAFIGDAIGRHDAEDRSIRENAAIELQKRLTDRELLFGARTELVSLPGSSRGWRSAVDER